MWELSLVIASTLLIIYWAQLQLRSPIAILDSYRYCPNCGTEFTFMVSRTAMLELAETCDGRRGHWVKASAWTGSLMVGQ